MTDQTLSPAAQAIKNAYGRETGDISCVWHPSELKGLAAVLHELADHVAPVRAWHESTNDMAWERHQMTVIINNRILAIAAELEATIPSNLLPCQRQPARPERPG